MIQIDGDTFAIAFEIVVGLGSGEHKHPVLGVVTPKNTVFRVVIIYNLCQRYSLSLCFREIVGKEIIVEILSKRAFLPGGLLVLLVNRCRCQGFFVGRAV